jgi:hypothetical protein
MQLIKVYKTLDDNVQYNIKFLERYNDKKVILFFYSMKFNITKDDN